MSLTAATIALAISAAFSGAPATMPAPAPVIVSAPPQTVKQYIQDYFGDKNDPIMVVIANCESHFRQFESDGTVYRGEQNHEDVGVMQINEHYHLKQAQALGYDLYSEEGNVAYAQYLFEKQGTAPWSSSAGCWDKSKSNSKSDLALANTK